MVVIHKGIRFINEKNASHRAVNLFPDYPGCGTPEFAYHVGGGHLRHILLREQSQRMENAPHQPCDRGLAGAGIAEEEIMVGKDTLALFAVELLI